MTLKLRRDFVTKATLSAISVFGLSLVGGLFYLQSQAATPQVRAMREPPTRKLIAEVEQSKLERILNFREQWQTWAKMHKSQLQAMKTSSPNSFEKMQMVADAIPDNPSKEQTGFSPDDVFGGALLNHADPVNMTIYWSRTGRNAVSKSPNDERDVDLGKKTIIARDHLGFEQMHDVVVICIASSWSEKYYTLWATGKVTESRAPVPELNKSYTTIAPSYDFLEVATNNRSGNFQ